MNDLILPPDSSQPKKNDALAKLPVEIVIDRRGRRPLRYGLIAAFIGLAGVAATHFYPAERSKEAPAPKVEAQAQKQITVPVLDEATKRRIGALQSEVQELRAKLDAMEKRQQAERASAQKAIPAPAPVEPKVAAASATESAPVKERSVEKAEAKVARAAKNESAKVDMTPVQTIAPAPKVVSGYRVRDVYRGAALIESERGMIGVEPGEFVPGVGRVIAIHERAGRWVVVTENGEIVGNPRTPSRAQGPRQRQFARELDGFMPGPYEPPFVSPY